MTDDAPLVPRRRPGWPHGQTRCPTYPDREAPVTATPPPIAPHRGTESALTPTGRERPPRCTPNCCTANTRPPLDRVTFVPLGSDSAGADSGSRDLVSRPSVGATALTLRRSNRVGSFCAICAFCRRSGPPASPSSSPVSSPPGPPVPLSPISPDSAPSRHPPPRTTPTGTSRPRTPSTATRRRAGPAATARTTPRSSPHLSRPTSAPSPR